MSSIFAHVSDFEFRIYVDDIRGFWGGSCRDCRKRWLYRYWDIPVVKLGSNATSPSRPERPAPPLVFNAGCLISSESISSNLFACVLIGVFISGMLIKGTFSHGRFDLRSFMILSLSWSIPLCMFRLKSLMVPLTFSFHILSTSDLNWFWIVSPSHATNRGCYRCPIVQTVGKELRYEWSLALEVRVCNRNACISMIALKTVSQSSGRK